MGSLNFFKQPDDRIEVGDKTYEINMTLNAVQRFINMLGLELPVTRLVDDCLVTMLGEVGNTALNNEIKSIDIETKITVVGALADYVFEGDKVEPEIDIKGNPLPPRESVKYTDFEKDFDYVYSAFIQVYGIDLLEERHMDYRKFRALIKSIPKDTYYREVISLRQMDADEYEGEVKRKIKEAQRQVSLE